MRIELAVGSIDGCKKVWATAEDEKVCKECGPLHDDEVTFDEYFFDNSYYNGLVPPEHYNCRCDANELRNLYRTQTRDLMGDQLIGRRLLDERYPNPEWEVKIRDKMQRKNMTRDEAIEDIYNTSMKSNEGVNKKLGLG